MVKILKILSLPMLLVCAFLSWIPLWLSADTQSCSGCQAEAVYFILGLFLYTGVAVLPFIITYLVADTLQRRGSAQTAAALQVFRFSIPLISLIVIYILGLFLL